MTTLRCSNCDKTFSDGDPGVAMPFCSSRCKLIDAGRWLGEEYGLPLEIEKEDDFSQPGRKIISDN